MESDKKKDKNPKYFRVSDEAAAKFREISKNVYDDQDAAFTALINAYEREQTKNMLPNRANDIDTFQKHLDILVNKYVGLLKDSETIEERIKVEFKELLGSKDHTILQLQQSYDELKMQLETNTQLRIEAERSMQLAKSDVEEYRKKIIALEEENSVQRETSERTIKDKESLINHLGVDIEGYKIKLQKYECLPDKVSELEGEIRELNATRGELQDKLKEIEYKMKHDLLEQKMTLREQYDEKLDSVNKKYEKRFEEKEKELYLLNEKYEKRLKEKEDEIKNYQDRIDNLLNKS